MLRSFPQLRATFEEYRKISSYDIVRTIEHEMSGDLKAAMRAVVMCVKNKPAYFAERLFQSMKVCSWWWVCFYIKIFI
jgi:annexin A7/11